ncbi:hypothetical protein [Chromobacterium vaccinii]|uniref:hypothetical protein n=1 Tax=Chromobacterium vaccinii TaxID=1108595 RepID=UPI0011C0636E|nr:hypothetical protein [Chromobacterium vaccinii]
MLIFTDCCGGRGAGWMYSREEMPPCGNIEYAIHLHLSPLVFYEWQEFPGIRFSQHIGYKFRRNGNSISTYMQQLSREKARREVCKGVGDRRRHAQPIRLD